MSCGGYYIELLNDLLKHSIYAKHRKRKALGIVVLQQA